jgi:hypothetical protein
MLQFKLFKEINNSNLFFKIYNRLLRINVDDASKKHIIFFWGIFIAIIVTITLLTMARIIFYYLLFFSTSNI